MSFIRLGASALSLTVSMFGPSAIAQTPATGPGSDVVAVGQPAKPDAPVTERVVVTGSLIRGTPENASLPVEIFTAEDLEESGAPTALEFVKQLSISGPTQGEANFTAGAGLTNRVQVNLRGLGVDKTLTLLNGRRVSDNTSNIPAAAIGRIEILKDGAAVTYGADATGGVINYITRKSFNGLEVKGQYKYIADSDGDYGLSVLGGFGEGEANFLWSAEWEHRSRLETEERSFSSLPYDINPSSWTTSSAGVSGSAARVIATESMCRNATKRRISSTRMCRIVVAKSGSRFDRPRCRKRCCSASHAVCKTSVASRRPSPAPRNSRNGASSARRRWIRPRPTSAPRLPGWRRLARPSARPRPS